MTSRAASPAVLRGTNPGPGAGLDQHLHAVTRSDQNLTSARDLAELGTSTGFEQPDSRFEGGPDLAAGARVDTKLTIFRVSFLIQVFLFK